MKASLPHPSRCPRAPDLTLVLVPVGELAAAPEPWLGEGQGGVWENLSSVCPARRVSAAREAGGSREAGVWCARAALPRERPRARGGGLRWAGCPCQAASVLPGGLLAGRLLIWSGTPGHPWTETPQNWPPRPAASPRRPVAVLLENEQVERKVGG